MTTIAITGGTSGIARYILDELVKQKKHKVVLLSRNEQPELSKQGVDVKVVDYTNIDSLKSALKGVETLISGQTFTYEFVDTHKNLLQACEEVGVKRFMPSEFSHDLQSFPDLFQLFKFKADVREILEKTKLEYTLVCCGLYMDYLLPKGAKKHLKDVPMRVDIQSASAGIPGTGDEPVTFTLAEDVGKAVAVLLDEPKWDRYTFISGDTISLNELVLLGERVTGKKFFVTYKKAEDVRKTFEEATDLMKKFIAEADLAHVDNKMIIRHGRDFAGVKFTSVEELVQKTYGK